MYEQINYPIGSIVKVSKNSNTFDAVIAAAYPGRTEKYVFIPVKYDSSRRKYTGVSQEGFSSGNSVIIGLNNIWALDEKQLSSVLNSVGINAGEMWENMRKENDEYERKTDKS